MSGISTHILDTSSGRPAANVEVTLEWLGAQYPPLFNETWRGQWKLVASARTDSDGRARVISDGEDLKPGIYRLTFVTGPYFAARKQPTLYPEVTIAFTVLAGEKYHIPLLLNPFGYSTYRGS
jgi:5-hydroxyisourate hydrolase